MSSRLMLSAAYCNQISRAHFTQKSTEESSVDAVILLMLSSPCSPKMITLNGLPYT